MLFYLIAPANSAPALNLATFLAAIVIGFFVAGLIPLRAPRVATENVPKPTKLTLSPAARALETLATTASRAFLESTLLRPASSAIALIKSALFIIKKILLVKKVFKISRQK